MHACIRHGYTYVCIFSCISISVYIYINMYIYIYILISISLPIAIYLSIHIYIYIYMQYVKTDMQRTQLFGEDQACLQNPCSYSFTRCDSALGQGTRTLSLHDDPEPETRSTCGRFWRGDHGLQAAPSRV